ncbi:MAG: PD-(D/E)XK nuclease family protein [Vampirovibrionales bacterium]|nr:PD-(D/E)XK nuclease family protein [Vampirovibrionales bacterium]
MTSTQQPNAWCNLPLQPSEPIWPQGEQVLLSPSGIATYAICPRQFYYTHWLKLKTPASWSNIKGIWIHWLLERLSITEWRQHAMACDLLCELATQCLTLKTPKAAISSTDDKLLMIAQAHQAFVDESSLYHAIAAGSKLQRQHLLKWTHNSLRNLNDASFFQRAYHAKAWHSEVVFEAKTWTGTLTNVQEPTQPHPQSLLRGTADVLMQDPDGSWLLLDFKSLGATVLAQKNVTTRLESLKRVFTAPDVSQASHRKKFPLKASQTKFYQLPVYYHLAMQQPPVVVSHEGHQTAPKLSVGIQAVRPEADVTTLILASDFIAEHTPPLLEALHQAMVQPLQQENQMPEAVSEKQACESCRVRQVCLKSV